MRVETENLERGLSGTKRTIEKMHRLVAEAKLDQTVQRIATWIRLTVSGDKRGHSRETADAIFSWVKRHGLFTSDPFQVEQITSLLASAKPVIDAKRAGAYAGPAIFSGDCDSYAMWVAALGGVLGFQYAFGTSKTDVTRPDEFSHIWAELLVGRDWYALDPSTSGASPGWRPSVSGDRFRRWPEKPIEDVVSMSSLNGHAGRNGMGYAADSPEIPRDLFDASMNIAGRPQREFIEERLPSIDPSDYDVHIPREPAPRNYRASERPMQIEPGDSYYPSPARVERRPYISTSPSGGVSPQYPFAHQVEIVMAQPIVRRREARDIVMRPTELMSGMGQTSSDLLTQAAALRATGVPVMVTQAAMLEMQAAALKAEEDRKAAEASKQVWSSITSTIADVTKGLADAEIAKIQAKYANDLAKATMAATGRPTVGSYFYDSSKPWYSNPLVILGALAALGTVGYFAYKAIPVRRRGSVRRRAG